VSDEELRAFIEQYELRLHEREDNPLHITIEDCNVADWHIEFCHVQACVCGDEAARLIAAALYRRVPDERRMLLGFDDYYAVDADGEPISLSEDDGV